MGDEEKLLSAGEADRLLASADGRAALLYLHILRSGGFSLTAASRVLRCSEEETALAAETLRRLGLMPQPREPLPKKELQPMRAEDIVACAKTDEAFHCVVCEAEKTFGRVLSAHDLEILFGIYNQLGLPADVTMLLLHHCVEEYRERNGPGRVPSMRAVEKEAWFWAEQEILNLDAAEEHLRLYRQRKEAAAQMKEALEIRGRDLTATERRYIDGWLALGFDAAAVAEAYDRTVSRTGRLAWKYMDKILRDWSEKQLFTPEEIAAGDPPERKKPAAARPAKPEDSEKQLEELRAVARTIIGRKGN